LRKAFAAAAPKASAPWSDITPIALRDWIRWITSARQPQTRAPDQKCLRNAKSWGRVDCNEFLVAGNLQIAGVEVIHEAGRRALWGEGCARESAKCLSADDTNKEVVYSKLCDSWHKPRNINICSTARLSFSSKSFSSNSADGQFVHRARLRIPANSAVDPSSM
jgi:hypothetical protein